MVDIFVSKKEKEELKNKRQKAAAAENKTKQGMGARYVSVAERLYKERKKSKIQTFSILPGRVRFETQEVREKVILLLRQHWVTQVRWIVIALLMIPAPLSLMWIPLIDFMPSNYQFMAIVIWYLLTLAFVYEKFISWFYRVFIVTDERIVDIDFYHLLYKEISEAKIDNVEDVTFSQGGVIKAMFNYGDVAIQTAAEQREFMIESVPEPSRVVKILNELKLEEEHEKIVGKVR